MLEQWIIKAYGGKHLPPNVTSLPQLRWYLYSKLQIDMERLPPTAGALKMKIFRSHFVTLVLRRSCINLQQLPPFENYGWENVDGKISAIMTDDLPAPLALIELSMCGCKTSCDTNRCKCYKNSLVCTEMCKCFDCKNDEDRAEFFDDIDSDSEDI